MGYLLLTHATQSVLLLCMLIIISDATCLAIAACLPAHSYLYVEDVAEAFDTVLHKVGIQRATCTNWRHARVPAFLAQHHSQHSPTSMSKISLGLLIVLTRMF